MAIAVSSTAFSWSDLSVAAQLFNNSAPFALFMSSSFRLCCGGGTSAVSLDAADNEPKSCKSGGCPCVPQHVQNNIENYNKAGKIYVPVFEKVIQTFLGIIDFIKLLFIKNLKYDNQPNHNILEQEINLNERI